MALLQGTKALETWCRLVTEGYANVNIVNMTTSWRSGVAFCAIIHKFRPDLINFDQLDPDDSYGNNELAFTIAEQHLGIPSLLDPQDMVECELLDRLSILTYLSQFYQTFHGATGPCKDATPTKLRYVTGSSCSSGSSTPSKSRPPTSGSLLPGKRSEPCKICSKPVFILERLHVSGRLLHRTCFKCARCNHQLSIANYYETESGSYCCDLCPDEEIIQTEVAEANKKIVEAHLESSDEADEVNSLPESQQLQATSSGSNNNNNNEVVVDQDNNLTATKLEEAPEIPTITISEDKDDDEEDIVEENVESEEKSVVEEETKEETDEKQDDECKAPIEDAPLPECDQRDESVDNQDENEEEKSQEDQQVSYPEDLNPFGDAEESEEKLPEDASEDSPQTVEEEKEEIKESSKKESTNPFGSESEEEIEEKPLLQQPPPKPPRLSLNPFGSDFEDDEEEEGVVKPKPRKKRHAPPPPTMTSSPKVTPPPRPPPPFTKSKKDEDNLNRRSQILEEEESITLTPMSPDKSNLDGKWKKKKGPAPPRPIPAKRQVKKLPRKAINSELIDIEIKQTELERQGVDLEKTIRELCEKSDKERAEAGLDNNDRDSLGPEAEDLIVQLFELVNEKNELFRRQTELMYMKREHRLEEEHADIEHQIRVLMAKPDALRTDEDKRLEDKLIERLMAIVSQRNEIVDCMEMDRLRELEEDESIEIHLGEYAAIKPPDEDDMAKKKKEKKKKEKKKKKKDKAYDADKDIDTSEYPSGGASLSNSPRPSPKKSPLALNDKEKAKKLKKKLLSSLKPITLKR